MLICSINKMAHILPLFDRKKKEKKRQPFRAVKDSGSQQHILETHLHSISAQKKKQKKTYHKGSRSCFYFFNVFECE